MRLRFWLGLVAVLADRRRLGDRGADRPRRRQRRLRPDAARNGGARGPPGRGGGQPLDRPARQRRRLLPGRGRLQPHEFDVVAEPLLQAGGAERHRLRRARARPERAAFERAPRLRDRRTHARTARASAARDRSTTRSSTVPPASGRIAPLGYDLGSDTGRGTVPATGPRHAASRSRHQPMQLLLGGTGINVFRPVYRDGAPTGTVAERRRALIGFAARRFRVNDLAAAGDLDPLRRGRRPAASRRRTPWPGPRASSTTPPARRSRSPTAPGCWSSAIPNRPRRQPAAAARRGRHLVGGAAGGADPGLEPQRTDAGAGARGRPGPADRAEEPAPLRGGPASGDGARGAASARPEPC